MVDVIISLTPSFSITNPSWMEQGGVYCRSNLRGRCAQYGKKNGHDAGLKTQKKTKCCSTNFIGSLLKYLIKEKYTSTDHLAIKGGSNGGLLGRCNH